MRQKIGIPLGMVLALAAGLFLNSAPSGAEALITWTPSKLDQEVTLGEPQRISVSLSSSRNLGEVQLHVVHEIAPYVTVEPSETFTLGRGDVVDVTLTIDVPLDEVHATLEGAVQVRSIDPLAKLYPMMFPVVLDMTGSWIGLIRPNYQLLYPPSLTTSPVSSVLDDFTEGTAFLDVDGVTVSVLSYYEPSVFSDLERWYQDYIAPNEFSVPVGSPRRPKALKLNGYPAIEIVGIVNDWIMQRTFVNITSGVLELLVSFPTHGTQPLEYKGILDSIQTTTSEQTLGGNNAQN